MICAGVVMLALSSCGPGGKEDVLPPTVEVKTTMIEAEGRSQYIYVKASSSWKITLTSVDGGAPVDWIIAAPSSGSGNTDVTLNVAANESEQERSAVLTVENSAGKALKTISQKGKKPEIKPDRPDTGTKAERDRLAGTSFSSGRDGFFHPFDDDRLCKDAELFLHLGLRQSCGSVGGISISADGMSEPAPDRMHGDWILCLMRISNLCCISVGIRSETAEGMTEGISSRLRTGQTLKVPIHRRILTL